MRLYQKALLREMAANSGLALGAISAILLVMLSVRLLGSAAGGDIKTSALLPFISFGFLRYLPITLSLSLFIGVLTTLTRYWQDSEMVIWSGAGLSPYAWIRPVLRFAGPIALIVGALSLALLPWVARQKAGFEDYLSTLEEEAANLTPGLFFETRQGNRVYFVESLKESGPDVRNVFIQSEQHGRIGIVVAAQGAVETMPNQDRFLVLREGRRYEGTPGNPDYRVMNFGRYGFRLDPAQVKPRAAPPRELDTLQLLREPTPANQAEWMWRLSSPISLVVLALFAIPLSVYNPRVGRSFGIILAILVYALYNNFMTLSQSWVQQGKLGGLTGLLLVHGTAVLVLLFAYWWRYGRTAKGGRA